MPPYTPEEAELAAKADAIIERQAARRRSQAEVHALRLPPNMAVPEHARSAHSVDGLAMLQGDDERSTIQALMMSTFGEKSPREPTPACTQTQSAQSVANPQPFTGYWQLPDGTRWWLKQWESRITGDVDGKASGSTAETSSGKIELSEDGSKAVINGVELQRLKPNVVVICGPSGVGKGTLLGKLLTEYPDRFGFSVSHTSRGPRPGEENGKDYHFSTKEEMQKMIADGEFVEYAEVHGNYYGTSRAAVSDVHNQGKICVLDIDIQGAQKVQKAGIPFVGLFIKPPSADELERRLRGRGTETEDKIQKRLKNAFGEIAFCDSHEFYWYELVNNDLEVCYKELVGAIGQSTQCGDLPKVSFSDNAAPLTGVYSA